MKIAETRLQVATLKATIKELRIQMKVLSDAQEASIRDLRSLENISGAAHATQHEQFIQCQFDLEILQRRYGRLMELIFSWILNEVKPELSEIFDDGIDNTRQYPIMHVAISKSAAKKMTNAKAKILMRAVEEINEYAEENDIVIDGDYDGDEN